MRIHNVIQGSPEWLALRRDFFTASEAPAMMGCSPYQTREQLLQQKATGITPEVEPYLQKLFDAGHAAEAAFRPFAEEILGEELYPVTGSIEIDGLRLLASSDGLTIGYDKGFEHKLFNEATVRHIEEEGEPPIHHVWQLEHEMLVSGANYILFATSDGTRERSAWCLYNSEPDRRAQLIAGWKQFADDLTVYTTTPPVPPKPVGKAPEQLPALRIELTGAVTASNLPDFKAHALQVIRGINRELKTDTDFANAEQTVKWCGDVESRIEAAKQHALSQTKSIDELFRALSEVSDETRTVRLELEKLVKTRKDQIRRDVAKEAQDALNDHLASLNERIGQPFMPKVHADFDGAIKGKRTIDSLRSAVNTTLATAKIQASEVADRITINLRHLDEVAADHVGLFPDLGQLVQKAADDFCAVVALRIAQEKARKAEAEKAAAAEHQPQQVADAATPQASLLPEATAGTVIAGAQAGAAIARAREQAAATVAEDDGQRLRLGEICARLGFTMTTDFMASLGFQPVATEKAARLYRACDFPVICAALIRHIQTKASAESAQAA